MTAPICRRTERITALYNRLAPHAAGNDLAPQRYLDFHGYAHASRKEPWHDVTPAGKCHLRFSGISMAVGWSLGFEGHQVTPREALEGMSEPTLTQFIRAVRNDMRQGLRPVPEAHLIALLNIRGEAHERMRMKGIPVPNCPLA